MISVQTYSIFTFTEPLTCLHGTTHFRLVYPCKYGQRYFILVVFTQSVQNMPQTEHVILRHLEALSGAEEHLRWLTEHVGVSSIELYEYTQGTRYYDVRLLTVEYSQNDDLIDTFLLVKESYYTGERMVYPEHFEHDIQQHYQCMTHCMKEQYEKTVSYCFHQVLGSKREYALEVACVVSFMI